MPDMDGLEVTRRIRLNPDWQQLPIIALTAQARREDHGATLSAGMNAHLTKPIDEQALYQTLAKIFSEGVEPLTGNPSALEQFSSTSLTEDSFTTDRPLLDLDGALERVGGQAPRLDRLLFNFWNDFSDIPDLLQAASTAGDTEALAFQAHRLKGVIGYLTRQTLVELVGKIENSARKGIVEQALLTALNSELRVLIKLVREALDTRESLSVATGEKTSWVRALQLIDAIEPLLANGDYAAVALLQELYTLPGLQTFELTMNNVINAFDALDLLRAQEQLHNLKQQVVLVRGEIHA